MLSLALLFLWTTTLTVQWLLELRGIYERFVCFVSSQFFFASTVSPKRCFSLNPLSRYTQWREYTQPSEPVKCYPRFQLDKKQSVYFGFVCMSLCGSYIYSWCHFRQCFFGALTGEELEIGDTLKRRPLNDKRVLVFPRWTNRSSLHPTQWWVNQLLNWPGSQRKQQNVNSRLAGHWGAKFAEEVHNKNNCVDFSS